LPGEGEGGGRHHSRGEGCRKRARNRKKASARTVGSAMNSAQDQNDKEGRTLAVSWGGTRVPKALKKQDVPSGGGGLPRKKKRTTGKGGPTMFT